MRGVFRRGRIWYISYYANGRRCKEAYGENKKAAEAALHKRKADIAEGRFLDKRKKEKIRFEEFATTFVELYSKPNKRPRVARRDEFLIKRLGTHFNGKYLYEITPQAVERYKSERIKEVAPATVNRELACLKCMFNKAIIWKNADENPVRQVKLFKENNARLRYLEKSEIKKLLDNAPTHLKPILVVALFTGMRKSEILNLQWKDINFEQGIIYLLQTKNGERREVLINDTVKKALIAVPKHPESPYVFCHDSGKSYCNVRKSFDTLLRKCGIIDFRFHDLRHTFASQLVMSGVDLKTVQELMGHKSIEMTLRYSHLSPDHKKKAVSILERNLVPNWSQRPIADKVDEFADLPNSLTELQLVA
jgi:integrase